MAIDALLARARPVEWWGVRPPARPLALSAVAVVAYVALGYALGEDALILASAIVWPPLLAAWLALHRWPDRWAIQLHAALCWLMAAPLVAIVAVTVGGILIIAGGLWTSSRG